MSDAVINGLAGAGGGIIAQLITYPLQTVRVFLLIVIWFFSSFHRIVIFVQIFGPWSVGEYSSTNRTWSEEGEEEARNYWTNVPGLNFFKLRRVLLVICTAFGCWENGREKGTHLFLGLLRRMCVFCIQICSLNLVDVAGHTKWRMGTVVRRFDAIVGGNSSISGEQSLARCWIVLLLLKVVSSLLQWLKIRSEWGEIYVCFSIA